MTRPLSVVADASYQEKPATVLLSPSASLTDADDTASGFLAAGQITAGSFHGDGDTLTIGGATSGTVTGITFLWDPTLHTMELTGASSPANYQALLQTVGIPIDERQSHRLQREFATDTDLVRIGWRGCYDHNDDDRYRSRERRAPGDGCCNRCVYRERNAGDDLAGRDRERRRQLSTWSSGLVELLAARLTAVMF